MLSSVKKVFDVEYDDDDDEEDVSFKNVDTDLKLFTLNEIKKHFDTVGTPNNNVGCIENTAMLNTIKRSIDPNKKNIFILDVVDSITDILEPELRMYLTKIGKLDKINIISMTTEAVGFDMLGVINDPDITVDALITGITFGGIDRINGRKIVIDGVDIILLSKMLDNTLGFIVFTGNIITENNENNYNFAKKFRRFMCESILKYVVIKQPNQRISDELFKQLMPSGI